MRSTLSVLLCLAVLLPHAAVSSVAWTFQQIAITGAIAPGGGTFTGFGDPSISTGTAAFFGTTSLEHGGYTGRGASNNLVVNTLSLAPGGGIFTGFGDPSISNGTAAFFGTTSLVQGVYTGTGASTSLIANTLFVGPGGGIFTGFGDPSISSDTIAFFGTTSLARGIYTADAGILTRIADTGTAIPDGSGNFFSFSAPASSNGLVAFEGAALSGFEGIYSNLGGGLAPVIDLNDLLDGRAITSLSLSRFGFDGQQLVFATTFSDHSRGIFLATAAISVPEPPSLILLAAGLLSLGWFRRRGVSLR